MPTIGDALAKGFTRRIWADSSDCSFDCLIKPEADLEGRLMAFDVENNEWVRLNGWMFDIDG